MGVKVRLLVSRAGDGFAQNQGDVIEVDKDEAKRMLEAGQCEPVAQKRAERAEKRPARAARESR